MGRLLERRGYPPQARPKARRISLIRRRVRRTLTSGMSADGTWRTDRDRGLSLHSIACHRIPGTQSHVASVMQ
jgi:hypothetical protein